MQNQHPNRRMPPQKEPLRRPPQRVNKYKKDKTAFTVFIICLIAVMLVGYCALSLFGVIGKSGLPIFHLIYASSDAVEGKITYFGKVDKNGNPTSGTLYYPDGKTAKVSEDTNEIKYSDGSVYTGAFKDYMRDGIGEMTFTNGDKYAGGYSRDSFSGTGTFTFANGDKYEGSFQNGKREGTGTYSWSDGSAYAGEFKNDMKNGKGKYVWPNGSVYDGEYVNDLKEGKGVYTFPNGDVYSGEFKNDMRSGKGVYTWKANGDRYEGDFTDNKMSGEGTYTWASGRTYTGKFDNGRIIIGESEE